MVSCLNDGLWWSRYDAEAQRGRHFLQAARDERERIRRVEGEPYVADDEDLRQHYSELLRHTS